MSNKSKFLVVDLDKSLLKIDIFQELIVKSIVFKPLIFIKSIFLLISGRHVSKKYLAEKMPITDKQLPVNNEVLLLLNEYKNKGYSIVLATGANQIHTDIVNDKIFKFDYVISSDDNVNCIRKVKLELIEKMIGKDFIYLGDSKNDLIIWERCKKSIPVNPSNHLINSLKIKKVKIIKTLAHQRSPFALLIKQFRIYQWSKNLLLFLPLLVTHTYFDYTILNKVFFDFLSFSLIASSVYLLNDIIDINSDRVHDTKKNRPIASGDIPAYIGFILFILFLITGFFLAFLSSSAFFAIILFYVILNFFYSIYLKKLIIVDIIVLTTFYFIRIIAGNIHVGEELSVWITAFSLFLFLSLGLVKRFNDLSIKKDNLIDHAIYKSNDKNIFLMLGLSSGLLSALILVFYIKSPLVIELYRSPSILFMVIPFFIYWISRIWLLSNRGEILSDPVYFTINDKVSYFVFSLVIITIFMAKYIIL